MASKRMTTERALDCLFSQESSDEINSSGSEYDPKKDKGDYTDSDESKAAENNDISKDDTTGTRKPTARKRQRKESSWQRVKQKSMRNSGMEYTNRAGKKVAAKEFKPTFCKCQYLKCCDRATEEIRKQIHTAFYATSDWNVQTQILVSSVTITPVKSRKSKDPANSHKQHTRLFYLNIGDVRHRVCKNVFLSTYGISNKRLDYALRNKSTPNIQLATPDQRGRKTPTNKTSSEMTDSVKDHINSFPKYCSHYGQKDSDRFYLHPELNVATMYSMYKKSCEDKGLDSVSLAMYYKIFNTCFNLHFYHPQKDTCKICDVSKVQLQNQTNAQEHAETERLLREHKERAEQGRSELHDDIKRSSTENDLHVFTFDLQRTLPIPHLNTNEVFYLRQMWLYNLGIHHYPADIGLMNTWNECEGKRGSTEIGSCLLDYIKTLPAEIKHVITYSDTCGGQNRNFPIASAMLYAVNSHRNLELIDMKFMESGHSFLPNDTDFGAISRKAKSKSCIYTPSGWIDIIKSANKKKPFQVIEKTHTEFKSFKTLENQILVNRKKNIEGDKVSWLKIKWMRFVKGGMTMQYKYNLSRAAPFHEVDFLRNRRTAHASFTALVLFVLPQAYPHPLLLKKEKHEDLQKLLKYIPPIYHEFYNSLPKSDSTADNLEQHPDVLEESTDSE